MKKITFIFNAYSKEKQKLITKTVGKQKLNIYCVLCKEAKNYEI